MIKMTNKRYYQHIWCFQFLTFGFVYFMTQGPAAVNAVPTIDENHFDVICHNILNLDCSIFRDTSVNCGTDGNTYNDSCQFAQGHCRSPNLHVQHTGACVPGGSGGHPLMEGLTVVLKLVCDDVVHVDCTGQPRVLLCASDGKTYVNNCFFEKARCGRYGLHVVHAGRC